MKRLGLWGLLFCLSLSAVACAPGAEEGDDVLLLAAASSLEGILERELIPRFQAQHEGIVVRGNYGGSFHLQSQIEAGLEADLFLFAAMLPMERLREQGLVLPGTAVPLLENTLVLIVRRDADTAVTGFSDILSAGSIAIGDPGSVPAGRYAQEVFSHLGIWEAVRDRASLAPSVTRVLQWVATGNAEVGLVYATDALWSDAVRVIAEAPPGSLKTPILYPAGLLTGGQNEAAARLFLDFLKSPGALAILESYGFRIAVE